MAYQIVYKPNPSKYSRRRWGTYDAYILFIAYDTKEEAVEVANGTIEYNSDRFIDYKIINLDELPANQIYNKLYTNFSMRSIGNGPVKFF